MSSSHSTRKIHLVGSRIRELRKGRRLTQVELSRMEQGEYKVGLDTLFKILQVFDLKMSEFFGESEHLPTPQVQELVSEFQALSEDAQREVKDFVRFKKPQENPESAPPEESEDKKA